MSEYEYKVIERRAGNELSEQEIDTLTAAGWGPCTEEDIRTASFNPEQPEIPTGHYVSRYLFKRKIDNEVHD